MKILNMDIFVSNFSLLQNSDICIEVSELVPELAI